MYLPKKYSFFPKDRYLPIANIGTTDKDRLFCVSLFDRSSFLTFTRKLSLSLARIMKNTLPENAKIAKDSKETVQEVL
jgi:hypothetical protein